LQFAHAPDSIAFFTVAEEITEEAAGSKRLNLRAQIFALNERKNTIL
jgi:hypothetical protein